MEFINKVKDFFLPVNEELIIDEEVPVEIAPEAAQGRSQQTQQVVGGEPISNINANPAVDTAVRRQNIKLVSSAKGQDMRIQIYTPQNFDTVSEIADALKSKRSAIVNYERVELAEQRRICDFLNGVCYVQDGEVRRITATMVLYVPNGVEINEIKSVAPDSAPVQL